MGRLRDDVNTPTRRKSHKKRYVRAETLAVDEVSDFVIVEESDSREDSETPAKRVRVERRYGRCSEIGHRCRSCKAENEDTENSDAS
jgi:hypothetical protein